MRRARAVRGRGKRRERGASVVESWDWLIQLVESGSFTRASEQLHISQQTLSSRLASLERELDTRLIVRSSPLSLTRAGREFLSFAREQNEARAIMIRRMGEATIGGAGQLKVGVSNMRSRVLMPHVVKQFHRSMPRVNVKICEGTNEELVRMAEHEDADLVIASFGDMHPGVTVRPLFREEIVLVAKPALLEAATNMPADEAIARIREEGLALLKDCPFLMTSPDDISGRIARTELRRARVKTSPLVESDSMMTLLSLCTAGLGAVFCPTNILDVATELTQGLARIRLSQAAQYEISLGRPASAEPWAPAQVFEDILGALFGDESARGIEGAQDPQISLKAELQNVLKEHCA